MANNELKYFIRKFGTTFTTTEVSSSGKCKPKASEGWKGFKTLAERNAWREKHKNQTEISSLVLLTRRNYAVMSF